LHLHVRLPSDFANKHTVGEKQVFDSAGRATICNSGKRGLGLVDRGRTRAIELTGGVANPHEHTEKRATEFELAAYYC
jgi:hypothetical protein